METICRFLPQKNMTGGMKAVHFVYEADFHIQKQPFIRPIYYLHLVTAGNATLRLGERSFELREGTLFFFFPAAPCEIDGDENFRYAYISFMGACVPTLLEELGVDLEHPVFPGFSHLTELWLSSIVRVNHANANLLTESVLLHSLSYLSQSKQNIAADKNSENLLSVIVDYVDTHYHENTVTLRAVADIFSYTEKYLSHFFKSKMGIGFNEYVNDLRLQRAHQLIKGGATSVTEIAAACGFSDPLYFSKVFKKKTGFSPREYIRNK